ncbi:MAG: RpiB/LacA/LacB family sugar-phosphate isomerase [Pseudobdellovibrio sp.]
MKKIFIASDHAGFELKQVLVSELKKLNLEVHDLGPSDTSSVDYPDYANKVAESLKEHSNAINHFGVLVCGSGQGMCIRANKYPYIRAALVYNDEITKLSREHNNANIICLGSRFCAAEQALKWIHIFLNTEFSEGRHSLRVAKIGQPV